MSNFQQWITRAVAPSPAAWAKAEAWVAKILAKWMQPCPWWHFWNPQSGPGGGTILGILICGVVWFILRVILNHHV